ncbi:hypothetical protein DERP_004844 [Dermatophagoides pteronyssinus]|uniref:Uncharacterized protein n=1 Tax=Dermatophagoides pteronyssinus TaxID=6956 RepID=A0ABQ8JSQ2_DERPT|nr:hypothetical protein DERP_004844 [Dermatophagoides pteronyssinus]
MPYISQSSSIFSNSSSTISHARQFDYQILCIDSIVSSVFCCINHCNTSSSADISPSYILGIPLLICLLVSCVDCDFFISVDFALLVIVLAGIDFLSIFGNGGNLDAIDPVDCDCLLIDCLVC